MARSSRKGARFGGRAFIFHRGLSRCAGIREEIFLATFEGSRISFEILVELGGVSGSSEIIRTETLGGAIL